MARAVKAQATNATASNTGAMDLRGRIVAVLGGGGFIGHHVCQTLLARGARLRVVSRYPERAHDIRALGNLGQVQLVRCDVTDGELLGKVLVGAEAVVNLVGIFAGDLDGVQGRGAGRIAALAAAAGASRFVHVSSSAANTESDVAFARTKAEGEAAVLAAFPSAVILRPALVVGEGDDFIAKLAGLIAMAPVVPVIGGEAKLQPVLVGDVAEAAANALVDADASGKTFALGGPETMAMAELMRRIARAQGRERTFLPLPDAVSGAIATLTGWLPGAPINRSQWAMLRADSAVAPVGLPGIEALGVTARPMGLLLDRWMVRYRRHGRFGGAARV